MSKKERLRTARDRKLLLRRSGGTFVDLARLASVSYSMAEKWMNVRRNSAACQRAFDKLTAGLS